MGSRRRRQGTFWLPQFSSESPGPTPHCELPSDPGGRHCPEGVVRSDSKPGGPLAPLVKSRGRRRTATRGWPCPCRWTSAAPRGHWRGQERWRSAWALGSLCPWVRISPCCRARVTQPRDGMRRVMPPLPDEPAGRRYGRCLLNDPRRRSVPARDAGPSPATHHRPPVFLRGGCRNYPSCALKETSDRMPAVLKPTGASPETLRRGAPRGKHACVGY